MTKEELAATLTGREYMNEITKAEQEQAKAANLVVVFGASDDLMEFRGAIDDEVGAYEGAEVEVDAKGLIPNFESISRNDKEALRDCLTREGKGKTIEALSCEEVPYLWTFKTDIPHATFEILDEGDPYCRGIVFSLADL